MGGDMALIECEFRVGGTAFLQQRPSLAVEKHRTIAGAVDFTHFGDEAIM